MGKRPGGLQRRGWRELGEAISGGREGDVEHGNLQPVGLEGVWFVVARRENNVISSF